jgi:hypothetical protein
MTASLLPSEAMYDLSIKKVVGHENDEPVQDVISAKYITSRRIGIICMCRLYLTVSADRDRKLFF